MNKKKGIIIAIISIVCVALVAAVIILLNSGEGKEIKSLLALGDKYLEEMEYEKAIVEYKKVLEIDPKNQKAISGIENALVMYADSLIVETKKVTITRLNSLKELMEENYPIVGTIYLRDKIDEVDRVIADLEEKKKLEEERREAEKAKKEEEEKIKEYQRWLLEQIYKEYDETSVAQCEKEIDNKYIYRVDFGACIYERTIVEVDKESGKGVVVQHLIEDFENGGYMDIEPGQSFVGREYDLQVTDEVRENYDEYTEYAVLANGEYKDKIVAYVNENIDSVVGDGAELLGTRVRQVFGDDYSTWMVYVTYGEDWYSTCEFEICIDGKAEKAVVERYRPADSGWTNDVPIPSEIDLAN